MFSFNRVHLIGYQTQPLALRQTPSGTSVVDLNLVVPYAFRADSGEMLEGKGFHIVTLWGPMADVAGKYMRPGSQVFITGRLQTDSWDDQQSGEKRSKTKVIGLDMILLDPKDGLRASGEVSSVRPSLNRAEVIGNVTKDPEIRTTTSGQQVLTLGVATNERWKDKGSGEMRERTEFHSIVLWGALAAEVAKSVKKGNRVYACGRVQTRSWETKDGKKRYTTEIVADRVALLGERHPLAESSISSEVAANRKDAMVSGVAAATPDAALSSPPDTADIPTPEVAYASEIKVEDLPF